MKPDLRIVSENGAVPAPAVGVETFTFVKSAAGILVYCDGRLVTPQAAVEALLVLFREAAEKREHLLNEIASTPGGLK